VSVAARMVRRAADSHDQIARGFVLTVMIQYSIHGLTGMTDSSFDLISLTCSLSSPIFAHILLTSYTYKTYKKQLKHPHRRI
jgi:hypothetical protein